MPVYRYVGPPDLLTQVGPEREGRPIASKSDALTWLAEHSTREPFTFIVDTTGTLRLAPRRSEHGVCAGGEPVFAAGEITFDQAAVSEISNQSTGYCPDLVSWQAVEAALERAELVHPGGFTHQIVFRRCLRCAEINVVRDNYFVCVFCETDLPPEWNVTRCS